MREPFAAQLSRAKEILRKVAGKLEIKDADERKQAKLRRAVLDCASGPEQTGTPSLILTYPLTLPLVMPVMI